MRPLKPREADVQVTETAGTPTPVAPDTYRHRAPSSTMSRGLGAFKLQLKQLPTLAGAKPCSRDFRVERRHDIKHHTAAAILWH